MKNIIIVLCVTLLASVSCSKEDVYYNISQNQPDLAGQANVFNTLSGNVGDVLADVDILFKFDKLSGVTGIDKINLDDFFTSLGDVPEEVEGESEEIYTFVRGYLRYFIYTNSMSLGDEGASWKLVLKSMYSEESKYKVFTIRNMSAGVWHVDVAMDYCDITLSLDIKEEQALNDALFPNYVLSNLEYALNDSSSLYGKNYNFTLSTSPDTSVRVKSVGVYTGLLRFIEGDFALSAVLRDAKTEKDNFTAALSDKGTFDLKIGTTTDEFSYAPICGYAGKYYGFYCD